MFPFSAKKSQILRDPTSLSDFSFKNFFSLTTRNKAAKNMIRPWPASPNMTENKKGKVMMAHGAEKSKSR